VNAPPFVSRDIEGDINFRLRDSLYEAKVEIRSPKDEKTFHYSIKSEGEVKNGFLKPFSTITRKNLELWVPFSDRNDETTLDYFYESDETSIGVRTDFYDKEKRVARTSRKSRKHNGINGLDYISAIMQIVLSNKQNLVLDKVDLISKMGKSATCPLENKRKNGRNLIRLLHDGKSASVKISLALNDDSEITELSFNTEGYGIMEMNVE